VALGASGLRPSVAGGPLYAQISISDACDHRCIMCPYHPPTPARAPTEWFADAQPGLMARELFASVVADLAALGTQRIDLVGRGEPLLHPDVVGLVRLARRAGLDVSITSNGSRLDVALAEGLVGADLSALRVSVDAARPQTYATVHVGERPDSLPRLVGRIAHLARLREGAGRRTPTITVSFTIGRENVDELDEMLDLAVEARADAVFFQHVLPMTERARAMALSSERWRDVSENTVPRLKRRARAARLESNLDEFRSTEPIPVDVGTTPTRCYVGYYFTAVLASGAVAPCCQTRASVGNAAGSGFTEVWRGAPYEEFRRAARRLPAPHPALATSECDRCFFRPHNRAVDRFVRPLSRRDDAPSVSVDQVVRMSRVRGR
jgi:MoaA/NifB/PqqE/SkfB family radical SAM enzyme